MRQKILINKPRGLYGKAILRLKEIDHPGRFIEWAKIYEKIGRNFSIKKQEIREVIVILRDLGMCDISPKGAKLNFEVCE